MKILHELSWLWETLALRLLLRLSAWLALR